MKEVPVVYQNGLPFTSIRDRLSLLIDSCKERIKDNLPSAILIDGSSGSGKTTIAVEIGEYYQEKPLIFAEQLANGVEDFKQKLELCKDLNHSVIIFDEAGEASRKSSPSKINRTVVRLFELYRGYNILVLICLPRFYFLEGDILQLGIIRALVHTQRKRGRSYSDFKIFRVKQMMMIRYWVKKLADPTDCYKYGVPQTKGHFLDLAPERSKELAEFSLRSKRVEMKKNFLGIKDRMDMKTIMQHFGKSRRWVELKLREIDDIGEVKVFQKKKWYEKTIIDKIDELEA